MQPKAEMFLERIKREIDKNFIIFETLRTKERQRELYQNGKSWTLHSHHLTGNAFDVVKYNGGYSWKVEKGENEKLIKIASECGLDSLSPLEIFHFQNNFKNIQMIKNQELIEEDYTPMSLTRMKLIANDWNEFEAFNAGLAVKTKPQTYRDLKDTISFGRIILMK